MPTFSKDEIFTATQVVRNFSEILGRVSSSELKRAIIVKNSNFEAVLISMEEYERLSNAVELLGKIYSTKKKEDDGEQKF